MKKNAAYEKFDAVMTQILKVPHSEIKAKLDAEKAAKKSKPKRQHKGNHDSR